ncbi:MAG: alpha/beta hydrolase [Microbacterium sp. 71-36]|uniref:alpha/beta fold hydrolase n=1 Tax=unclassified Microbacterium TaxID=2609290 RepID=UPI0008697CFD|nr:MULTISPECIES: alpha/beta hydrolase [unclassified Microbacterium]MBN9210962.1 alpha/beta hydrolase [Microbacterium sp.]ODT38581.1 MAG: hydrolase [Microbacterium sp. SCN 71-17]OJV76832.1 MAG: alpha/beta hydrolase [Microbacterium sp. 71-36]
MDVILVPGLWLDASSWDAVVPALTEAGHRVHPLTLPTDVDAGIRDWVDAVVAHVDAAAGPVVLVGHSGGGNVVWGAADARPDRISRVVFVDTMPPPPGAMISEFPVENGVVPFPGWDFFDEPDIADLDDETRRRVAASVIDVPGSVPTDPIPLSDERRHDIPVTVLSGRLDEDGIREALTQWGAFADEFERIGDVEVITLDSGHWPQFSQPEAFAARLVQTVR